MKLKSISLVVVTACVLAVYSWTPNQRADSPSGAQQGPESLEARLESETAAAVNVGSQNGKKNPSDSLEKMVEGNTPPPRHSFSNSQKEMVTKVPGTETRDLQGKATPDALHTEHASGSNNTPWSGPAVRIAGTLPTGQPLYELSPGVPAPAAFVEIPGEELTPGQAKALNQIGDTFDRQLGEEIQSGQSVDQAYENTRIATDEYYRMMFGDERYNQKVMKSAREAMELE